jgi:formylglycine-generating enzyme required for sulfatase activity
MKTMKNAIRFGLSAACLVSGCLTGNVSAQILHVDSVMVDSVWNSDNAGKQSRDCKISFIPRGEGTAMMTLTVSLDSGKTFAPFADSLNVLNYALYAPFTVGQKDTITVRILGGDRTKVAFRMTAEQDAPVIAGSPKVRVLGPTGALAPGSAVQPVLSVHPAGDTTSFGFCTIATVYWDTAGNGNTDSSTGAGALSWTWHTKVPAGAAAQTRKVIAYAVDKNGLKSLPETLSVQFGLHRQIVMKNISAGTFQMGDAIIRDNAADTVHQVTLSAFAMQETPVTQEQYDAVVGANPSYSIGDMTRPVDNVSWFDAVLYCNALSKLSGLDTCYSYTVAGATDAVCNVTKQGYRLPTEAESEYAARGGTTTTYWWGPDTNNLGKCVYEPVYNSGTTTIAVASGSANGYGLYDVEGNGWKWCNDWFSFPYSSAAVTNPKGPAAGISRVQRGGADVGSQFVLMDYYRSGNRGEQSPSVPSMYSGFCCAMTR